MDEVFAAVIASEAKQSVSPRGKGGWLRRFALRNDGCRKLRLILKPTAEHQGEHWGFPDLRTPIIHERRAFD